MVAVEEKLKDHLSQYASSLLRPQVPSQILMQVHIIYSSKTLKAPTLTWLKHTHTFRILFATQQEKE